MELAFQTYALLAALLLVAIALWAMGFALTARRKSWHARLSDHYLRNTLSALTAPHAELPYFPQLDRSGSRLILAQTIAGITSTTYGIDPEPLRQIVKQHGLDTLLARRVRHATGFRRARALQLLSRLPIDENTAAQMARYTHSRSRPVRLYAFLTQLSANPSAALRLIATYPHDLSACELAEVIALLRRGMLPIAYEPLVLSPNHNLQAVGLEIIRQFGIEEAEGHLLRIVAGQQSALGRRALYVLCDLRRPLDHKAVASRFGTMSRTERTALLRYMALEGYSAQALHRLCDTHEKPYYESLVKSYKRCLV